MKNLVSLFKKNIYIEVKNNPQNEVIKPKIPDGMWVKCEGCGKILYRKDLEEDLWVCNICGYHFRISARERINQIVDKNTFKEMDENITTSNPLNFEGYENKINSSIKNTGLKEAVVTGYGKIRGNVCVICVMDSRFMMGSMGSVVGEKITRAVEFATKNKLPILVFTCSGGARMHEGIFSLMQMAKTSAAIGEHDRKGLLYLTVLTDPTTGGVTASYAMLGDIILAEPKALVGFAGRRVIEQTIKQHLPEGFQTSEFLEDRGFIDKVVKRNELKETIASILKIHRI